MMRYIRSANTNPYFNLALEEYVFNNMDPAFSYFMLWQNDNSIIVGKHQNTIEEINSTYVKEHGIRVARRLSGGGAVYHDLGNLNFTFIMDAENTAIDFSDFCKPIVRALAFLGVRAEVSGRNDMTISGKKFSGNSQYRKRNRVMHHGTLMFSSDLNVLTSALKVSSDKFLSKGLKSMSSRVTNIRPHLDRDITLAQFWAALEEFMFHEFDMSLYFLSDEETSAVKRLQDEVYSKWDWNYGRSPEYQVRKERRIEGCGKITVLLDVGKQGKINDITFFGDYFGNGDQSELRQILLGQQLDEENLSNALDGIDISQYFNNLDKDKLLKILLQ